MAMGGTTGLVYGIFRAGSLGLGDSSVRGLLIASLVLLAGFVVYELRRKDPVLEPPALSRLDVRQHPGS